jgi:hypothetical protein
MPERQATPTPEFMPSQDVGVQAEAEKVHRSRTRRWFTTKPFFLSLAVIFLIGIIWVASSRAGFGNSDAAKSGSQVAVTNAPQVKAVTAAMGSKARDGDFEFVVTGVQHPGKTLAGKVGETLIAHGEFVIVKVNVTNVGKVDKAPSCSCQILITDKGQMLKASSSILRTKDALKFVQLIPPGSTVNGVLMLFDVAPGTNVVNIQLHDTPASPGVNVKLS